MKTIVILILIYLAFRIVKNFFLPHTVKRTPHQPEEEHLGREGREDYEETALDPVCGSYVPVSSAVMADEGGERVYFCSAECRDKYSQGQDRTDE